MIGYNQVVEELKRRYMGGFVNTEYDDELEQSILQFDFHEYMMDIIRNNPSKEKVLMKIMARIMIRFYSYDELERELLRLSATFDRLTYGLLLACGVGCKEDREKAIMVISETDSEIGAFFNTIQNDLYSKDEAVINQMLKASKFIYNNDKEVFRDSLEDYPIHCGGESFNGYKEERYLEELLDLVIITRYMDTKLNPKEAVDLLASLENYDKYPELQAVIFHMCRPFTYVLNDILGHSRESFLREVDELRRLMSDWTGRLQHTASPLEFVTSDRKGFIGLEYLLAQSCTSSRTARLLDISPYAMMMDLIGSKIPNSIDPEYINDRVEFNLEYLGEGDLEGIMKRKPPLGCYIASKLFADDPELSEGWLRRSASKGLIKAQQELVEILRSKDDPDYVNWELAVKATFIREI